MQGPRSRPFGWLGKNIVEEQLAKLASTTNRRRFDLALGAAPCHLGYWRGRHGRRSPRWLPQSSRTKFFPRRLPPPAGLPARLRRALRPCRATGASVERDLAAPPLPPWLPPSRHRSPGIVPGSAPLEKPCQRDDIGGKRKRTQQLSEYVLPVGLRG